MLNNKKYGFWLQCATSFYSYVLLLFMSLSSPASGSKSIFKRLFGLFVLLLVLFLLYLDISVVAKFSGQKWRLPTHVYARPIELYQGKDLSLNDLIWELDALGYRHKVQLYGPGQYRVKADSLEIRTRGFEFWDGVEVPENLKLHFSGDRLSELTDSFGTSLPIARLEPLRIGGIYPDTLEDRKLVLLSDVPPLLIDSLLAVEDSSFYEHWGLSLRGIARALIADIKAGAAVQGGSTITQQLIKNFYLTSERSISRKLLELVMAPLLELHYDKDEILETYLNEVYFGQSGKRSIQGVGLASQYYFGQPINELGPHQIAFLVGVIKGPSQYDPWRRVDQSKKRRDLVLSIMARESLISEQQSEHYRSLPLDVWQRPARSLNPYPAYMSLVRAQLAESFDLDNLGVELEQGLNIFTSLDPIIQRKLEKTASTELRAIESQRKLPEGTFETAALVTKLGSSKIVALMGGRRAGFDGFNRATQARRAIGSLIKPAIYLSALQKNGASWATLVSDEPLSIDAPDHTVWQPLNYDKESHGNMIMLDALINSYNQATARLGLDIGVDQVIQTLKELGVEVDWKAYPAILLGSGAMSPLEVSMLYQTIANDGFGAAPTVLESVYSADHQPIKRYSDRPVQKIDSSHAHLIQYGLQMVMLEGTGTSAFNWLDKDRRVAGKTGTTNDQRDSWFAGFGGEYLSVFWVGRDDNEPTPLTGSTGALRLWSKLMADIEQQSIDFVKPDNVSYKWVNRREGGLSAANCDGAILVPLIKGSEPGYRDQCADKIVPRILDWFRNTLDL